MARRVLSKVGLAVQGKGIDVEAIFDTGATRSFVSPQLAEKLGYIRYDRPREVLLAIKIKRRRLLAS